MPSMPRTSVTSVPSSRADGTSTSTAYACTYRRPEHCQTPRSSPGARWTDTPRGTCGSVRAPTPVSYHRNTRSSGFLTCAAAPSTSGHATPRPSRVVSRADGQGSPGALPATQETPGSTRSRHIEAGRPRDGVGTGTGVGLPKRFGKKRRVEEEGGGVSKGTRSRRATSCTTGDSSSSNGTSRSTAQDYTYTRPTSTEGRLG